MTRYTNNHLLGLAFMMLAMFLFETMDAIAKWLVSDDQSATQILALRSWMIVTMIIVFLALRGELGELRTRNPVQHAIRGIIGFIAPFSFFLALKTLPLADATVVFFSSTFILTAASGSLLSATPGRAKTCQCDTKESKRRWLRHDDVKPDALPIFEYQCDIPAPA